MPPKSKIDMKVLSATVPRRSDRAQKVVSDLNKETRSDGQQQPEKSCPSLLSTRIQKRMK